MAPMLTKDLWKELLAKTKTFLLDCDGVIWNGDVVTPGAPAAIAFLKNQGKKVILVTNNSGRSRASFADKCKALGIDGISADDVVTTSAVLADYLKNVVKFPASKQVYIIGSQGISYELSLEGISSFGFGPDGMNSYTNDVGVLQQTPLPVPPDQVGAVVVGYDPHISFPKALKAASYLKNPACSYVATNDDETFPCTTPGIVCPGTGSVVAMITTASRRTPVILGKPNIPIFTYMEKKYDIQREETVMIGDTLRTDIQFAKVNGIKSILVLTGQNTLEDVQRENVNSRLPDFVSHKLGDLAEI